jgi:hypothetical protein
MLIVDRLFSLTCCLVISLTPASIRAKEQLPQPTLREVSGVQVEACADRIADHIHAVSVKPLRPRVVVLDFSNHDSVKRSLLGVALADELAEAFGNHAKGFELIDRNKLHEYVAKHWLGDEELRNNDVTKWLGDQLQAAVIVQADLEILATGQLKMLVRVSGLGSVWSTESRIALTEEMQRMFEENDQL